MNIPNIMGQTALVWAITPDSIQLLIEGIENKASQMVTVSSAVFTKLPKLHETIVVDDYIQVFDSYSSKEPGIRVDEFIQSKAYMLDWLATDHEKEDYRIILEHAVRTKLGMGVGGIWDVTVENMNAEYVRATIALNANISIGYQLHAPELTNLVDEDDGSCGVSYSLQIENGCPVAIFRKVKYRMELVVLGHSHYANTTHDVAFDVREQVRSDPRSQVEGYTVEQMSDLLASSEIYRGDELVVTAGNHRYFDLYLAVNRHITLPKWMGEPLLYKHLVLVKVGVISRSAFKHVRSYSQERVAGIREWITANVYAMGDTTHSTNIYDLITRWIFEGIGRKDGSVKVIKTEHSQLKQQLQLAMDSIVNDPDFESLLPPTGKPTFWVVSDLESWVATNKALVELTDYQTQLYLIGYGNQFGGIKLSLAGNTEDSAYVERYNSTQFSVLAPVTYVFNTYPDSNLS